VRAPPENLIRHEPIKELVGLLRLTAGDILLMQRSQLISGGLVFEPVVDRPRPLMNRRILRAPAGWADVRDFTIERRVILPDPVGQGVFLRLDLAGSSNLVLACRQIELLIVLVDLLEIILSRLQVVLGSLPMTDRGPHRSIAGRSLDLRLRSVHNRD
jgi:hypothetical protein